MPRYVVDRRIEETRPPGDVDLGDGRVGIKWRGKRVGVGLAVCGAGRKQTREHPEGASEIGRSLGWVLAGPRLAALRARLRVRREEANCELTGGLIFDFY